MRDCHVGKHYWTNFCLTNQVEKILPRVIIIGQFKETTLNVVRALTYSDPEESAPKAGNQFPKSIKSCRTLNCGKNVEIECCLNTIS